MDVQMKCLYRLLQGIPGQWFNIRQFSDLLIIINKGDSGHIKIAAKTVGNTHRLLGLDTRFVSVINLSRTWNLYAWFPATSALHLHFSQQSQYAVGEVRWKGNFQLRNNNRRDFFNFEIMKEKIYSTNYRSEFSNREITRELKGIFLLRNYDSEFSM